MLFEFLNNVSLCNPTASICEESMGNWADDCA